MPINIKLELSIILPIYKVEPYLEKCIRSLENQDIPKDAYEIICVNDGSPDNCKQIIIDLQKEYSNIVLIDQKNQGVSVARNNGIQIAKGEYLMFVDPDDAIEKNCLKKLLEYANTNNCEVVYSPLTFVEIDGAFNKTKFNVKEDQIVNGPNLYFLVRGKDIIDPDRTYAILYKRKLIVENNLFYLKDVPYLEDGEFIARVLCLTKRGCIYNQPYYLRLNRPGSATRSDLFYQRKTISGFIKAAKNLKEFKSTKKLSKEQEGLINGRIVKFVVLAIQCTLKNPRNYIWVKSELKKEGFNTLNLSNVDKLYLTLGKKYNRSINFLYISSIFNTIKQSLISRIS